MSVAPVAHMPTVIGYLPMGGRCPYQRGQHVSPVTASGCGRNFTGACLLPPDTDVTICGCPGFAVVDSAEDSP